MAEFETYESARIKGATAYQWSGRGMRMVFVLLGGLVITLSVGAWSTRLSGGSQIKAVVGVIWFVILYSLFASMIAFIVVGMLSRSRDSRERERGYSTLPLATENVDVIDVSTGLIIRRADEPPLKNMDEVRAARAAAQRRVNDEGRDDGITT